jgi:hypothetical protein
MYVYVCMYIPTHARAHGLAYPPSPLSLPLALAPSHPHPPIHHLAAPTHRPAPSPPGNYTCTRPAAPLPSLPLPRAPALAFPSTSTPTTCLHLCFLDLSPDTPDKSQSFHRTAPSSPRPCWRREDPWRASRLDGRGDVTGKSRADCRRDGVGEGGDQVGLGTLFYYGRVFESLLSFPLLSLSILRCCAGRLLGLPHPAAHHCALTSLKSLTPSLPSLTS